MTIRVFNMHMIWPPIDIMLHKSVLKIFKLVRLKYTYWLQDIILSFGISGGILAGAVGMSILINNWNSSGLIQSAVIAAAVSFNNHYVVILRFIALSPGPCIPSFKCFMLPLLCIEP